MSSITTDEDRCITPTSTSAFDEPSNSEAFEQPMLMRLGEPPSEDRIYIIQDLETELVLSVKEGNLRLDSLYNEDDGTIQWRCIRNDDGWYGFKNMGSGTFIGHNGKGKFIAEVKHHKGWEHFRIEHHQDGGHVLLVRRDDWFRFWLEPMEINDSNEDTELVVTGAREKGTAWKFVRVG